MAKSRVNWKGDAVKRKAELASRLAIDATMSAAIILARSNHNAGARGSGRFESHSGDTERGIKIIRQAERTRKGVTGRWGAQLAHARRLELGFQGKDKLGRVVNARAYPFLRPAAQAEYPKLAGRVRTAFAIA